MSIGIVVVFVLAAGMPMPAYAVGRKGRHGGLAEAGATRNGVKAPSRKAPVSKSLGREESINRALAGDWNGTKSGGGIFESHGEHQRLERWRRKGFVFEGPWRSDEVALVLDVLDLYSLRIGEARFRNLVAGALEVKTSGRFDELTFVRRVGSTLPTAGWLSHAGEIFVYDSLFDGLVTQDHYPWVYPPSDFAQAERKVLIQQVTIAHEVGHVVADGLRVESDPGAVSLEERYAAEVKRYAWPHPTFNLNENLATEIALWVLEEERPDPVVAFAEADLAPAIEGIVAGASQR